MCGIFGLAGDIDERVAFAARDVLAHRGPDSSGRWFDADAQIWLGHLRLSIVDLSPAGAQPMVSHGSRYVVSYNGEVFNHRELRADLEKLGHRFVGHSDTEVMLAAIEQWGLEPALQRLIGFFAIALWDRQERVLSLVRDRLGIKPLYYASGPRGQFAFGSELRSLEALDWVDTSIDPDALDCFMRYQAVAAPASIFRGVSQLPPGGILSLSRRPGAPAAPDIRSWWSIDGAVARGQAEPFTGTFDEAVEALDTLLYDAVRRRMEADVPVGAFLSGGVDSSLVAALMRRTGERVRTFTIGFNEPSHDESPFAEAVAAHLGCDHVTERLGAGDALALVPRLAKLHDEPFADVSSLPTHLLCVATRRKVTVALSGDGGDELFGGYPRYFWADRIERMRSAAGPLAPVLGRMVRSIPNGLIDGPGNWISGGRFSGSEGLSHRVHRFGDYLAMPRDQVYASLVSAWPDTSAILSPAMTASRSRSLGPDPERFSHLPWAEQMMATDQSSYLADDILTKVDRMSMAVALEVRVPILDHRVVEFAWRLPLAYKCAPNGDRGKLILRAVLDRYVPRNLIDRPKIGFGVPLGRWLRGPLKTWAGDLIAGLGPGDVIDRSAVRSLWDEHLAGTDHGKRIWTILMFLEWRAARVGSFRRKVA